MMSDCSKRWWPAVVLLVLIPVSCRPYGKDVREALRYAGDNREELEHVIRHYSQDKADTLKLKAALYLIGNMTWHRSYPAEAYSRYCREMDSVSLSGMPRDSMKAALESVSAGYERELEPVFDVRNITAEYLIWNIEYSFNVWENTDWLQHLDFSQFCEYVLPYKCVDLQPLTKWKEEYADVYRGELDWIKPVSEYRFNARMAAEAVQERIKDSVRMERIPVDYTDILDIRTLMHLRFGNCYERSVLGLMNSRSKGIPVTLDFTPAWADRNVNHHWNNVLSTRRRNIDFEPFRFRPGDFHYTDNPYAKVRRCTFAPDPLLLEALKKDRFIPASLMPALFSKDVTDEYGKTSDLSVHIDGKRGVRPRYAYLCVFNNEEWVPVDIARVKHGKAMFASVGKGLVYIVCGYDRDRMQVFLTRPFVLDSRGRMEFAGLDKEHLQDMHILRKFPAFGHIYSVRKYLRRGRIEASDSPDFRNAGLMVEFPEWDLLAAEKKIADTTAFRYWRLKCSHDSSSDFAELYFYERGTGKRISGTLVTPGLPIRNHEYDTPEHICDGNPLTYFAVVRDDRWVGFDFGRPVSMGEVAYIRRGDGNDICPDQVYELYYWDDGRWVLHDRKTADRVYLDFEDVPSDALYYIKCITTGEQNRIFFYENGEQIWY